MDVTTLRRLATDRRGGTLVATMQVPLTTAIDDAVDVFAVVMSEKLIRPAERASDRRRLGSWGDLAEASTTLASTGRALLELIADTDEGQGTVGDAIRWLAHEFVHHQLDVDERAGRGIE